MYGQCVRSSGRSGSSRKGRSLRTEEEGMQLDLFSEPEDQRHRKLMQITDALNKKFGDDTINFGL